jgi:thioredoxin 1
MPFEITSAEEWKQAITENRFVVADMYSPYCGPCKSAAPKFQILESHCPGMVFVKMDVNELDDIATFYDVSSMPTFIVIVDGKVNKEFVGADLSQLSKYLEGFYAHT